MMPVPVPYLGTHCDRGCVADAVDMSRHPIGGAPVSTRLADWHALWDAYLNDFVLPVMTLE